MPHGFYSFHANHLEDLRDVVVKICQSDPLPPLENDMFLVQSNGIAQWLKLSLAESPENGGLGIATSLEFTLPASFVWRVYRAFLSTEQVPESSPLDKASLCWRIYRLLPSLCKQNVDEQNTTNQYSALRDFLSGNEPELRRFQLSQRLADLYDQYQVYRADWLTLWEQNKAQIHTHMGLQALSETQQWQASFWRVLLEDVGAMAANTSRASVHQQLLNVHQAQQAPQNIELLPKRVFVFGVSSLSKQTLQALHAVSRYSQVIFCVVNPCQYYWADIVSDRELLTAQAKRGKLHEKLSKIEHADIHQHANPILASLGKQGRDFIRLLDEFDQFQDGAQPFSEVSQIDIYRPHTSSGCELLSHIQNDIFDLLPISEITEQKRTLAPQAQYSLEFHQAYSKQREVEILHDQLLAAFARDPQLQPSDIIVMMPNVDDYAAHIRAVFSLHSETDKRHIPFTISDQGVRKQAPLMHAFETLLNIADSRFSYSDVIDLLEHEPIRSKAGLTQSDLDALKEWVRGANICWGLSPQTRGEQINSNALAGGTWLEGLRSLFLGYALDGHENWGDTQAYNDVGGLQAALLGPLLDFVDNLAQLSRELNGDKTIGAWQHLLSNMLNTFIDDTQNDALILKTNILRQCENLHSEIALANALNETFTVNIFKQVLLNRLENSTVNHKFMVGKVNFASLMPMRAIPFKRVYLLGMGSDKYPRSKTTSDFDLMANDYRPGDRSMRDDDRYLFLEALLSARESLYISWVGRSIVDDAEQPPSVLVAQLQDYVNRYWQVAQVDTASTAVELISCQHPLQAFSQSYFENASVRQDQLALFTYAKEWRSALNITANDSGNVNIAYSAPEHPVNLRDLTNLIKHPVKFFYNRSLLVYFEDSEQDDPDTELFMLDSLGEAITMRYLLEKVVYPNPEPVDYFSQLEITLAKVANTGDLGIQNTPQKLMQRLRSRLDALHRRYSIVCRHYPTLVDTAVTIDQTLAFDDNQFTVNDVINGFRQNGSGELARVCVTSSKVYANKNWRFENVLATYIEHVFTCASGKRVKTFLIDAESEELFLFEHIHSAVLRLVTQLFVSAYTQPLPLHAKACFAYMQCSRDEKCKDPIAKAIDAWEQCLAYDEGYLRASYPNAETVPELNEFTTFTQSLYAVIHSEMLVALAKGAEFLEQHAEEDW